VEYVPPFSNGMDATLVLGQPDFTTNNSNTTQNGLSYPRGLAFDSSGNLWVADADNSRVLEYTSPFSTGMNATLVLGQSSFTTGAGATTADGLAAPYGLAFDFSGNLWVADGDNNRVLEYVPPFSTGMDATLVLGQSSFTVGTSNITQNGFYLPAGLVFDTSGNILVGDWQNSRALVFAPPFSNGMNASLVLGQADFTHGTPNQGNTVGADTLDGPSFVTTF